MKITDCDRQRAGETIEALDAIWQKGANVRSITHRQHGFLIDLVKALRVAERVVPSPFRCGTCFEPGDPSVGCLACAQRKVNESCPTTPCSPPPKPESSGPSPPSSLPAGDVDLLRPDAEPPKWTPGEEIGGEC